MKGFCKFMQIEVEGVMFNLEKFRQTPLKQEPFPYLVVDGFIAGDALDAARNSFPDIAGAGSHPDRILKLEGAFATLLAALKGREFQKAVEEKFSVSLAGRPTMSTIRGFAASKNGDIHRDSKTKLMTVLLYMNDDEWESAEGRLRILYDDKNLSPYAEEIAPTGGTLLVFQCVENAWHGHAPFTGPRRAIQLNWVTGKSVVWREQVRHSLSSWSKRLFTKAG